MFSSTAILNTETLIPLKETHQSSYYEDGLKFTSDLAIDGNLLTCAHTQEEKNPWWNIELLGLYEISNITIYNVEQHNIKMDGSQIRIGNTSETNGTSNSK